MFIYLIWLVIWALVRADDVDDAVNGPGLVWAEIPSSELAILHGRGNRGYTAHYTTIYAPVLYGNDAEKYGISSRHVKNSYFQLHLRRFKWRNLEDDPTEPIKHVLLVSGGPGESGNAFVQSIYKNFKKYGPRNLNLYVADHRGVYNSANVLEKTDRNSFRSINKGRIREREWFNDVPAFEASIGYPVVAMSCTNAARDLALITRVLKRYIIPKSDASRHKIYIHAQSYGTMVAMRAMQLLPNAYEAVLLDGLASMEMVEETARADYGILKACEDDRVCRERFLHESHFESVYDIRKMMREMESSSRNAPCRSYFTKQLRKTLYSDSYSFTALLQTALYELQADDFAFNEERNDVAQQYAGMLIIPLIKNLYFCKEERKFRRQTDQIIQIITERIRGKTQSAKSKSFLEVNKTKNGDGGTDSYFVSNYINAHEAFDMRGMKHSKYCAKVGPYIELGNQCTLYFAYKNKLERLKQLTGHKDKFSTSAAKERTIEKFYIAEQDDESPVLRRTSVAQEIAGLTMTMGKKLTFGGEKLNGKRRADETDSSSDSSDSSDSDEDAVRLFSYGRHKHHHKKGHRHHKRSKNEMQQFLGVKKSKSHSKMNIPITAEEPAISPSHASSSSSKRRYYYDIDELAYTLPMTSARVYVIGGTLDIKTPINTARRIFSQIEAPQKRFFEVEKMAHTTRACSEEIYRAFLSGSREKVQRAEDCLRAFKVHRELDWNFGGVDWW